MDGETGPRLFKRGGAGLLIMCCIKLKGRSIYITRCTLLLDDSHAYMSYEDGLNHVARIYKSDMCQPKLYPIFYPPNLLYLISAVTSSVKGGFKKNCFQFSVE